MYLSISYSFLQEYWWFIISLLASLLVFLMFVQGGQSFIFTLPRNDLQKTLIINSMGRKWEFTFTTLVTFGGAFFASFPLFYATSFGGAYWVWIIILFSFVIQAIAFEFRSKPSNILGSRTFETFLFINGSLGPLLLGVAVATFFTGSDFSVDRFNNGQWGSPWRGLEALLNLRNISLGVAVLFLSRLLGLMYIINSINDKEMEDESRKRALYNSIPFLAGFLFFVVSLMLAEGFAVDPGTSQVFLERYKYLNNLLQMPAVLALFAAGVIMVLFSIYSMVFTSSVKPVWNAGAGTIMVVMALFLIAGYNDTAFYPSMSDLQSSLTIRNASSSAYTLKAMMYVSFFIPVVMVYVWYAWRAISRTRITGGELEKGEGHVY